MTPFLRIAGWALIHFVWQGAVIALAAAAALRVTERRSASVRYVIACAGLAAMLAAPAITARALRPDSASVAAGAISVDDARLTARATSDGVTSAIRHARPQPSQIRRSAMVEPSGAFLLNGFNTEQLDRLVAGVTIAWLLGVVILLGRMAGGWWHVRRLHRIALATSSSRWQTTCRRLAYRLGLPAAAHVVESALVDVPTVVGWLRPAILLPVAALASLTPVQVEAILAHELAHIRRHDYAVNVLQTIAETLLFYHPGVWWLSKRIRTEA